MGQDDVAARESAAPVELDWETVRFDAEADVVVVGGGAGGLPAALFARWLGDAVILLEKAPQLGGTANKAAFWYWVPNNAPMRALGLEDPEDDFLRYCARLTAPERYDPSSPTLGLAQWEFDAVRAVYESAAPAVELLAERDALPYRHCAAVPDYWAELPEDKAPSGRVLVPEGARETMSDGGEVGVRTMSEAARRDGVDIRTGHRVQRLVTADGAVVGVEASIPNAGTLRVRARKAVIFASGGFTHDLEMRRAFLSQPVYGGCGATTNEGDFVRIATPAGAQLRNMNYAWMCPVPLEAAVQQRPDLIGMFSVAGDSTLFVDKTGRRVVNEKLPYNELAQLFFTWDPVAAEYPNLVLIQVWDERSQRHSASDEYGRLIVGDLDVSQDHVIRGETIEELAERIRERLGAYAHLTGGLQLSDEFAPNLHATIARFNELAATGVDLDFGRGERVVQQLFNGDVKEEEGR